MSGIKSPSGRKFYSLPENPHRLSKNKFSGVYKKREELAKLVKHIDESIIGKNATFTGPYGRRKVVYCDYEASGRSLQFLEDYILREVLPNCGNTASTANTLSLQSILFRHEAKEIFRICVNASESDTVVFTGLGCGGPMSPLIDVLRSNRRKPLVVFVGPCERTSTILSWKELGAKVIRISESKEGFLDLNDLENQLIVNRRSGGQLIGCFSAANSVTGILADDVATTILLHQYGALAFWDYSTAAPSVQLDMNPTLAGVEETAVHKDAMFFSCHKFIGGIQTPGILVAKKFLFRDIFRGRNSNNFESNDHQELDVESDLERGTITVIEDVRGGLVMHLKEAVGVPAIISREEKITRTVLAHVKNIPELILLGSNSQSLKRLPVFSFVVRHPRGMFLHHNFVCSVLNDVFGIQAQGSSADGGSHFLDFMGIDVKLAEEYDKILSGALNGAPIDSKANATPELEALRPGFTRMSFPFCISDGELGFILEALKMVATEGWKLLPQYILKSSTGEWRHHSNSIFRDRKWLGSLKYIDGRLVVPERKISTQGTCPLDFEECLHVARCIFNKARKMAQRYPLAAQKFSFDADVEPLRWFMLPNEAHNLLIGNSQNVRHKIPFDPARYKGCKGDPVQVRLNESEQAHDSRRKKENLSGSNEVLFKDKADSMENSHSNSKPRDKSKREPHPNPTFFVESVSQRQNSYSSETSTCDFFEAGTQNRCPPCHSTSSSASVSHSPGTNSLEAYCFSPQPSLTTPYMNPVDTYSCQLYGQVGCFGIQGNHLQGNHVLNGMTADMSNVDVHGHVTRRSPSFGVVDSPQMAKVEAQQPMNKVHFLLGRNDVLTRQRCNSLGSSLVLRPRSRGNSGFSCRSLTDGETSLNLSECSLSSNEDIHAYVTEVTKELATEIKSEIREVISKVEDVLSDSIEVENNALNAAETRGPRNFEPKYEKLERTNSLPSASANDIAQYLMGVSKEMAEEMKTEIRGLVSSVVSPDSSPMFDKTEKKSSTTEPQSKERKEVATRKRDPSAPDSESFSESRDSGINLSYSENGLESRGKEKGVGPLIKGKNGAEREKPSAGTQPVRQIALGPPDHFREGERSSRCRSESLDSLQENEDSDVAAANPVSRRKVNRTSKKVEKTCGKNRLSGESSNDETFTMGEPAKPRWYSPSKAIWKPTIEALKEFDMIRNGDRVLVCLSEGKTSLVILHALQQYKCYASSKGIHFDLGAVTFSLNSNSTVKPLAQYLDALGIPHYSEEGFMGSEGEVSDTNSTCQVCWKIKRGRVFELAQKKKYNVVALGQNLDDLAEHFLLSVFHNGRLGSMKAHYYVPEKEVRVIRPFVYVRERALKQFAESRSLPAAPENCSSCKSMSKERQNGRQLLFHQESLFPRLFASLKSALHPLLSRRWTDEDSNLPSCVSDSDETSLT